jgi:hypothetical protein
MIRLLLALVVLASAAGSVSATPVRGQCEGTRCEEFEIVERKVVREGGDGTLVWTRLLGWTRDGFQRLGERQESGHVFCSTVRPAVITTENDVTSTVMLAPLSSWEYDKHSILYTKYFEACHDAGAEIAFRRDGLARELGYKAPRLNSSRPLGLTKPESIFYFPPINRRDRS